MFKRAWTDSDMLICWYMLIYVETINKSGCFSWSYPFIPRFGGMNIPETETILNYRVQYSSRVLTLRTTWEFLPHGSNSSKRSFTENWGKLIWIKNPKRIYSLSIYIIYIYIYIWYNYYNQWGFHTFKVCSYPLWLCAFIMIPRKAKQIATSRKKRKSEANNNLTS